jgi:hypothetical protein
LNTELQQRQRLPVADCLALGAALAEALTHLHRHGLVHRDIKPANVIFVRGQPELADIGLVTESEANAAALGTEGFIAPEGAGTPAGDVYALGKVLYELSTGLDRKRYPELPVEIGEWPDRKAFMALNAVIGRACAARTEDRCASAADLLAELQALKDGGAPEPAPRPARKHPLLQLTLALGAAAGLLVAGAALWRHLQPPPAADTASRGDPRAAFRRGSRCRLSPAVRWRTSRCVAGGNHRRSVRASALDCAGRGTAPPH